MMQFYFIKDSAPLQVFFSEYYYTFQKNYFIEHLQANATVSYHLAVLHNILKTSCMSLLIFFKDLQGSFTSTGGVL